MKLYTFYGGLKRNTARYRLQTYMSNKRGFPLIWPPQCIGVWCFPFQLKRLTTLGDDRVESLSLSSCLLGHFWGLMGLGDYFYYFTFSPFLYSTPSLLKVKGGWGGLGWGGLGCMLSYEAAIFVYIKWDCCFGGYRHRCLGKGSPNQTGRIPQALLVLGDDRYFYAAS